MDSLRCLACPRSLRGGRHGWDSTPHHGGPRKDMEAPGSCSPACKRRKRSWKPGPAIQTRALPAGVPEEETVSLQLLPSPTSHLTHCTARKGPGIHFIARHRLPRAWFRGGGWAPCGREAAEAWEGEETW